jgi:CRISPR-associated protein Csd1
MLAFQLISDTVPVHLRPAVRALISRRPSFDRTVSGRCLVTGRVGRIARLHPPLKRVPEGQSSGTSLVSFNASAFSSHGLSQGDNAPISEDASVAYTAALNQMLESTDTRRYRSGVRLGENAVLLVWTESESPFADDLVSTLDPPFSQTRRGADRTRKRRVVAAPSAQGSVELLVEAPWRRLTMPAANDDVALFGVVLSGNAARAMVRASFSSTIADAKAHVGRWFRALALDRSGAEEVPTIPMIVRALEPPGGGLPTDLSSRLTMAAVLGRALPAQLLRHALLRFQRDDGDFLSFSRAAVIKACLVNLATPRLKETDVSLDEGLKDQSYLLGRLFATLERAQENALPGLNATIRDRYFTAASTSPGMTFPRLLRLAQHHVSKAEAEHRGFRIARMIQEIVAALPVTRFPPLLSLADQGVFAIGYYQQRQAFFAKRAAKENL